MSYYDKPLLLMFYGIPGSSKSFFASQLVGYKAVRLI